MLPPPPVSGFETHGPGTTARPATSPWTPVGPGKGPSPGCVDPVSTKHVPSQDPPLGPPRSGTVFSHPDHPPTWKKAISPHRKACKVINFPVI